MEHLLLVRPPDFPNNSPNARAIFEGSALNFQHSTHNRLSCKVIWLKSWVYERALDRGSILSRWVQKWPGAVRNRGRMKALHARLRPYSVCTLRLLSPKDNFEGEAYRDVGIGAPDE